MYGYLSKPTTDQNINQSNVEKDCTIENVLHEYRNISSKMDVQNPIDMDNILPFLPKYMPVGGMLKKAVIPLKLFDYAFDVSKNLAKIEGAYKNICDSE